MKRTISLICAVVLIALSFTGCKKNIYVDDNGVSHTLVMKHGEAVQDKYGNFIVKDKDENGKKVESIVKYPVVTEAGKDAIQNAVIKMKVPDGWKYNSSIKAFRLQHKDCPSDAVCQIDVEIRTDKNVDEEYRRVLAAHEVINFVAGDDSIITGIEKFTTKIFGHEAKAYKTRIYDESTYYCYVFAYENYTVDFIFNIQDGCFENKFNPEDFIKENVTLKTLPKE